MRNIRYRKYLYGIQKKIFLFVTLMLSILFCITYFGINKIVTTNTYEALSEQNEYINDRMLNSFEKIKKELDELTSDFILNEYVQKSLTNQVFTASDIEMMKKSLAFYNKSFLDYYLLIDNKQNLYSQRSVTIDMDTFKNSEIYKSLGTEYSKTKILWARDVIFGANEMSFFVIRYIHEMNSFHTPGILVMKLNDSILEEIRESITDDQLVYFILDGNKEVCFSQLPGGEQWNPEDEGNREMLWTEIIDDGNETNLRKGILNSAYDENTQFTIITYVPEEVSNRIIRKIQYTMAAVFGLTYSVALICILIFTRKFTKPIKYISDTMNNFDESRLELKINLETNTELDSIGYSYNKMLEEVKSLMDDVKNKEHELLESQIQSMLYQIRPHFLYNTLDTIYMLARIQKEETIMKMIQALSRFLRINLSNGKEEIEVAQELEHVSSYLEIQKIRNAELFTYDVEADEGISTLYVTKMILQPVVENCIKYGFRDIFEGGIIKIRAFSDGKYLCFSVENNGESMEEEQIKKMNSLEYLPMEEIDELIKSRNGGYGICNVVKRLRMRYQDKIRFYYVGKENGTECIIKIELGYLKDEVREGV